MFTPVAKYRSYPIVTVSYARTRRTKHFHASVKKPHIRRKRTYTHAHMSYTIYNIPMYSPREAYNLSDSTLTLIPLYTRSLFYFSRNLSTLTTPFTSYFLTGQRSNLLWMYIKRYIPLSFRITKYNLSLLLLTCVSSV